MPAFSRLDKLQDFTLAVEDFQAVVKANIPNMSPEYLSELVDDVPRLDIKAIE